MAPKISRCVGYFFAISFSTLMILPLAPQIQVAYAGGKSPYESGYDHGCDDAGEDIDDRYINQPERGPSFHTEAFMRGYNDGYDECSGQESQSSDDDEAREPREFGERHYEGWNWRQICSDVDDFISEPCSDLVTSDGNALTAEGKATLERIACRGEAVVGVILTQNLLAALQGLRC